MIEKNEEGGDLDGRKKAKGSLCGSFTMTLPHPVLQRLVKAAQAERE